MKKDARTVWTQCVQGKLLHHFSNHATALLPWAEMAKALGSPPLLVTLDHHTDANPAWLRSLFGKVGRDIPLMETLRQKKVQQIDPQNSVDLTMALDDLHHDEQLDLALRLGIVRDVVVIQHSFPDPLPEWAEQGITVLPFSAHLLQGTDANLRSFYDRALEDDWLGTHLDSVAPEISPWNHPFILDIDLDYFKTYRSLDPCHAKVVKRLFKQSVGITVAEEPAWVDRLWMDASPQSGELLGRLINLIGA